MTIAKWTSEAEASRTRAQAKRAAAQEQAFQDAAAVKEKADTDAAAAKRKADYEAAVSAKHKARDDRPGTQRVCRWKNVTSAT